MTKPADTAPDELSRLFHVNAPDASGVRLGVLAKNSRPMSGIGERSDAVLRTAVVRPVLLVHGATFGAALFDLAVPGYSLMSEFARAGRPVYALDIRGYGHSLSGHVMDAAPQGNPPFARLTEAVQDVGAAIADILAREKADAADLVGFSWGTIVAARYASEFPQHVARLALYAPLYGERNEAWLNRIGDPKDRTRIDPAIGAYRLITQADLVQRWDNDIGGADPQTRRDEGLPEALFAAFAALDPKSRARTPHAFRSPTGALADLVRVFNGQPLYDPARITMPVLLVRGADDTTSTDTDCSRLLADLGSKTKNYRVIAPGSHFLCLEKNRAELHQCLNDFLAGTGEGERRVFT